MAGAAMMMKSLFEEALVESGSVQLVIVHRALVGGLLRGSWNYGTNST
jgi:hypothetical protein